MIEGTTHNEIWLLLSVPNNITEIYLNQNPQKKWDEINDTIEMGD